MNGQRINNHSLVVQICCHQIAAHMACQSISHHTPQQMTPRTLEISPRRHHLGQYVHQVVGDIRSHRWCGTAHNRLDFSVVYPYWFYWCTGRYKLYPQDFMVPLDKLPSQSCTEFDRGYLDASTSGRTYCAAPSHITFSRDCSRSLYRHGSGIIGPELLFYILVCPSFPRRLYIVGCLQHRYTTLRQSKQCGRNPGFKLATVHQLLLFLHADTGIDCQRRCASTRCRLVQMVHPRSNNR